MVIFRVFATFRQALGAKEVTLNLERDGDEPLTVGRALEVLLQEHPALDGKLLDPQGELLPHVNVFVDGRDIRHRAGLQTPLRGDETIALFPPLAGG